MEWASADRANEDTSLQPLPQPLPQLPCSNRYLGRQRESSHHGRGRLGLEGPPVSICASIFLRSGSATFENVRCMGVVIGSWGICKREHVSGHIAMNAVHDLTSAAFLLFTHSRRVREVGRSMVPAVSLERERERLPDRCLADRERGRGRR